MKSEFLGNKTFTQLKKSLSKERMDDICKQLVLEYADSGPEKSETYFCKKYSITPSCYKKMKDYAFNNNLVGDDVVHRAMNKAIANQKLHNANAGWSSVNKTFNIFLNRQKNSK